MMMMTCGHAANGVLTRWQGQELDPSIPYCVICDCAEIAKDELDLTGRLAKCCHRDPVPSRVSLAFFKHLPDQEFDSYYCGHAGWD
jgi:hypothetical protein